MSKHSDIHCQDTLGIDQVSQFQNSLTDEYMITQTVRQNTVHKSWNRQGSEKQMREIWVNTHQYEW